MPTKHVFSTTDDSSLVYLHQIRTRSQAIYLSTLFAVTVAILILPFLYVDVSVKGVGRIQSAIEKTDIVAPFSGRLMRIKTVDNQKVRKGDTLFTMDGTLSRQQHIQLEKQKWQLQQQLKDAQVLVDCIPLLRAGSISKTLALGTSLYKASWQQFNELIANATNTCLQAERIYQRYQLLYFKKVVTLAEYEAYKFNYQQALSEKKILINKYKSQWLAELLQYRKELGELHIQQAELKAQEKQYEFKATISGSVQYLIGLQPGAYVVANQKIGEISPDSALIAYCKVTPSTIGLIRIGQEVKLQLDAFNFNQWGLLAAKVVEISDDIVMQNQIPYFKVKCTMERGYLQLKNGYHGDIKKGMTFTAHFKVAKRSLYQLLYDKVDDWLNPLTHKP
jgi:multidrug resistance efflux pump